LFNINININININTIFAIVFIVDKNRMKFLKIFFVSLLGIIIFPSGCVLPFEPQIVEDTSGILVVEGMILEKGTKIKLTQTVRINSDSDGESNTGLEDVHNARIRVIDNKNNVVAIAEQQFIDGEINPGIYVVTDEISFAPGMKYALNIQIGEKQYQSSFVSPVDTPEIDEITWKQNADMSMDIMVSTHDPKNKIEYYRWSFEEDWEIRSWTFSNLRYDWTTETKSRIFINMEKIAGEDLYDCGTKYGYRPDQLENMHGAGYGIEYRDTERSTYICAPIRCLDCTFRGGTKNKPDFWPNDHL